MEIKESTFLITGGSSGIGKSTAIAIIKKGGKVAITGRDENKLKQVAEQIGAFPIHADVGNPKDIEKTYSLFLSQFNKLDCLINNAGIGAWSQLTEITLEEFQKVYNVNVFGAALMGQKAAQIFQKQNYGNIINIASTASTRGFEKGTIYSSSKFALRGMTECWRAELRKYNIRVMLINPSEVITAFFSSDRQEKEEVESKLRGEEIAHVIVSALEMDDRGFIPELSVWATNPKN